MDGGYIGGTTYYIFITDHLGSNRVVANTSGTAIQNTHYYPFGTAFSESTGQEKQPYKYNGKELDLTHGLNLYDYSARYMDSPIGRFTSVDPLAEKYYSWSPYVYGVNNPILNIDPDGRDYWSTSDPELIRQFMNALGSGASVANMSGWNHATDAEFLDKGTFNDETGKFHTSYATYENGVATVTGVTLDTNIKPGLASDGSGYLGAFVYQYEDQFWATLAYHTYDIPFGTEYVAPFDPTRYNDGVANWKVNTSGRITGLAPITGYPPAVGRGGKGPGKTFKGGKQSSRDSSLNRYPKDFAKWYHREVKGNSRGDASAQELAEWYSEWVKMGKPIPK